LLIFYERNKNGKNKNYKKKYFNECIDNSSREGIYYNNGIFQVKHPEQNKLE
jgi:hypothetical protein